VAQQYPVLALVWF